MTSPVNESDQQIADDVLPVIADDLAVPVELNQLMPWHRPRKQFIRERQWIYFSERLINEQKNTPSLPIPPQGVPEVRYLTLPGTDYLDVRLLGELCLRLDCCLTSTGFLAGGETNPYVARAKVREGALIEAGYITDKSYTFRRRLEDVTSAKGQAYREIQRKGPFHIVNIDACGSIAAPAADHATRLIDAIYRIIEFQFATKSGRWLLFVTADIRHNSIAAETLCRLCKAIYQNADEDEGFRNSVLSLFGENDADITSIVSEISGHTGEKFLKLFSLGFAKWLLHLARAKEWDMHTHSTYCYSTKGKEDETPTMVCLAFEFLPPPPGLHDRFQVSRAEPIDIGQSQDTSIRVVTKISEMANLDNRMRACANLREQMVERTKQLLKEIGYSPEVLRGL